MVISYFGDRCFRIESGGISLLMNPNSNRLKADVVVRTAAPANSDREVGVDVSFAGEYEIGGIEIQGWQLPSEGDDETVQTGYLVVWDGVKFVLLHHLSGTVLPEGAVDRMGDADILFLSVDGDGALSPKEAAAVAKKLEPTIVIPTLSEKTKRELKEFDRDIERSNRLVFKKKDLIESKERLVVFSVK